MATSMRFRKKRAFLLNAILFFILIAALVFYWLFEPILESSRHMLAGILLSYLSIWSVLFLSSNANKREMIQRFLLTSASIIVMVCFFELLTLAGIVDYRLAFSTPIYEPWRHPDNLLDPRLLHIRKPNLRFRWSGIEYRYDRHGFRNESDLTTADVVVTGDSFIEGWSVSAADLMTAHLSKQLDFTVANLGQSWYGPQQELEVLRRYGLQLRPKFYVWAFFEGNDLYDVRRYSLATMNWENFSKKLHAFRQRSFLKNALLAVRRFLNSVHHRNANDADRLKNQSGVFKKSSGRKIDIYFSYKGLYLSASDHKSLVQLRSSLLLAYEMCRVAKAKFLVVFIPTKFRVYNGLVEFDAHAQPRYWMLNDLPNRVESIVREDLPDGKFLDLTQALSKEARNGSLVYFPHDDTHWSPEGHRVAAAAIADVLKRWEENGISK